MIAIGADHGGYELKEYLKKRFAEVKFQDFGAFSTEAVDYPDIAILVANEVAKGNCEGGILICRSGIGMDIMANKVKGIRAALCLNPKMAEMAKKHEDANILALGADYLDQEEATKVVEAWLGHQFEGGRHQRRIDKIKKYEENEV